MRQHLVPDMQEGTLHWELSCQASADISVSSELGVVVTQIEENYNLIRQPEKVMGIFGKKIPPSSEKKYKNNRICIVYFFIF